MNPGGAAALRLLLDEFAEGRSDREGEVTPAALGLEAADCEFADAVRLAVSVRRAIETFAVQVSASTRVQGQCCRCLAAAQAPLAARLDLLLQRRAATADELEAVAEDDQVEFLPPGTRLFDLTEAVRQALVLELPVRLYCRADCRGLCPRCGGDRNRDECGCAGDAVDPRWEKLAKIKFA